MATSDDRPPGQADAGSGTLPEDEELALEELSDEIVKRYAPERLLKTVRARAGRGEPLDWTTRNYFERKLGVDLGDVRIYSNELARRVARSKGAEALTVGTTKSILMGGAADRSPLSSTGRGLLAHELTHVAQNKRKLHPRKVADRAEHDQDEREAHAAEHEEQRAHEAAAGGTQPKRGLTEQEYMRILHDSVVIRVLEMFEEDHRLFRMRAGRSVFRW